MISPLFRIGVVVAAAALLSCAHEPKPKPPPSKPRAVDIQPGMAGTSQRFFTCTDCERPTPKTLASPTKPATTAQPVVKAVARPTPLARAATADAKRPTKVGVTFAVASAELSPAAIEAVDELAPHLRHATRIRVNAYTDNTGPARTNQRLAEARSLAVMLALREQLGDRKVQLIAKSAGRCCYVDTNNHEAGRSKNRRAEIEITYGAAPDASSDSEDTQ